MADDGSGRHDLLVSPFNDTLGRPFPPPFIPGPSCVPSSPLAPPPAPPPASLGGLREGRSSSGPRVALDRHAVRSTNGSDERAPINQQS